MEFWSFICFVASIYNMWVTSCRATALACNKHAAAMFHDPHIRDWNLINIWVWPPPAFLNCSARHGDVQRLEKSCAFLDNFAQENEVISILGIWRGMICAHVMVCAALYRSFSPWNSKPLSQWHPSSGSDLLHHWDMPACGLWILPFGLAIFFMFNQASHAWTINFNSEP